MSFVVHQTALPIVVDKNTKDSPRFPVNRIYGIALNYRDHAIEMGQDHTCRDSPIFFQKPADAAVEATSPSVFIPVSSTLFMKSCVLTQNRYAYHIACAVSTHDVFPSL